MTTLTTTINIYNRLADIEETISYKGKYLNAARSTPTLLEPNLLPLFVNEPGNATYKRLDEQGYLITRQWQLTLFVRNVGDGIQSIANNELDTMQLMDAVVTTFVSKPLLQLSGIPLNNILETGLVSDSIGGAVTYPAGDDTKQYYAIRWIMAITYTQYC